MIELEFKIDCLDGRYCFSCRCDEDLDYSVDTDIAGLESVEAKLDQEKISEFSKCLDEADIEKWDRSYSGENEIEDGIRWSLKYTKDGKEYFTDGRESFEPYCFENLIKAIKLCDRQIEYFGW